jgi:PIN domain nuclease of toxin-antitoxin system
VNMLLDTQALLWFLLDDPKLSNKGRDVVIHAQGAIFVSPASSGKLPSRQVWENTACPSRFSSSGIGRCKKTL